MDISRRRFIETTALSGLAVRSALGEAVDERTGMPTRILGKTGARVSVLAFGGGGGFYEGFKTDEEGIAALNRALDLGITYIDTAARYGEGKSEFRIGQVIKSRRKEFWVATKIHVRKRDEALRILEGSLKRLQLNQFDLVHIHGLSTDEDLAAIEAKDGALSALYKLRDEKVTRFIGVTSHTRPALLKTALERHNFDCTQMALNAARAGWGKPGLAAETFESIAIPVARRLNMGITAMKVMARDGLIGKAPLEKLIHYPISLPIASAVIAMPSVQMIEENIRIAKAFKPMSQVEMDALSGRLAAQYKAGLDAYFEEHVDC